MCYMIPASLHHTGQVTCAKGRAILDLAPAQAPRNSSSLPKR